MSQDNTIPPAAPEAEMSVLAAMLMDNSVIAAVRGILASGDFYASANREIYAVILDLHAAGGAADIVLLENALRRRGTLDDVGGMEYLTRIAESAPSAANAVHHARLVREFSQRRRIQALGHRLVRMGGDGFEADALAAITAELQAASEPSLTGGAVLRRMADVEPEEIHWLWPGRIALGKLTLLVGDPGLGKSFLTLDMAARVSRGRPWPDHPGAPGERGAVILLSAEDDAPDTIRPRLDAAEADVTRIFLLEAVTKLDGEGGTARRMFCLQADLPELERAIERESDVRLVVVDPISAYLGGADSHKNADIRGLLAPLSDLAARHKIALVAVSHFNKASGASPMYRTMGSLAFTAAARAVWCVSREKDNPERRLLLPIKNNLAKDGTGLAYSLQESPDHPGVAVVAWEPEPVTVTAEEALRNESEGERGDSPIEDAEAWLREALSDGPLPSKDVLRIARENGHSERTLRRAKKAVGIVVYRDGFGAGATWYWRLPGAEDCQKREDCHTPDVATFGKSGNLWSDDEEREAIQAEGSGKL
ncbi:MAG: AAA family ATPase [Planctomycetota bacterium]